METTIIMEELKALLAEYADLRDADLLVSEVQRLVDRFDLA